MTGLALCRARNSREHLHPAVWDEPSGFHLKDGWANPEIRRRNVQTPRVGVLSCSGIESLKS